MRNRPLFIRLCEILVENLALILRVALVFGAIAFVQELREAREHFSPAGQETASIESTADEPAPQPDPGADDDEPWMTDGVKHALNCTHTDYRDRHYDECVQEPSEVYRKPDSGADDDISFIAREDLVLYARLEPNPD